MAYRELQNVTATDSLETRLEINARYAAFDFHAWVIERLAPRPHMDVLDVGCGTGVHALRILDVFGANGTVSAFDLAADSVMELRRKAGDVAKLYSVVGDMKDTLQIIARFPVCRYDLAYSVYALWYSPDHHVTLDAMRLSLKPRGRLVVCTPNAPNGLRETLKRCGFRRPELEQATHFGPNVLEPYFRAHFEDVRIFMRRNVLRITSTDDVLAFFRATGYYDPALEAYLKRQAEIEIEYRGYFAFEKNNYLIEGSAL
jgi:SAM-dependent methyltransferase